jgi:hypothetical protein
MTSDPRFPYRPLNGCSTCGCDFASVSAFDRHRTAVRAYTYTEGLKLDPPVEDGRRCMDEAELLKAGMEVDPRALEAIQQYREKQEQRPAFVSGSHEEAQALDIIDAAREEDLEKERRKSKRGGVLVCNRIEGGELVQYLDVRASIHDRPAIVRVGP